MAALSTSAEQYSMNWDGVWRKVAGKLPPHADQGTGGRIADWQGLKKALGKAPSTVSFNIETKERSRTVPLILEDYAMWRREDLLTA
jgi:hypothetical protein